MSWQNAFDLGSCTVTFNDWSSPPVVQIFSQVMGKGDQKSGSIGETNEYTVSVSTDGEVTLEFSDDPDFSSAAYEILVTPSYPHDFGSRISGLQSDVETRNVAIAIGEINATAATEGVDYLNYTISGDAQAPVILLPDPLDMSALSGTRDLIGVYIETQGV